MTRHLGSVPEPSSRERGALFEERREAVARLLADHGAGGVILSSRRDFAWLTLGGLNHVVLATEEAAAPVLVTRSRAVVLAPVNEAPRIRAEEVAGLPLEVEELPWWDETAMETRARHHVGSDALIEEAVIKAELAGLRQQLVPIEHARLAWLGGALRAVVDDTLAGCERGTTEHEVAAAAVRASTAAGMRCPVLLVAADERIELFRHPLPTAREVRQRVMLVLVGERWGLHAALTGLRELEPPSPETARRNAAVAEVLEHMREATKPGRTLGDVVAAAQERYTALGFADEWRLHHQGGSIGYAGRERIATPEDATPILPGMAFAWNPSVRGAKAEETFYLTPDGRRHVVTD